MSSYPAYTPLQEISTENPNNNNVEAAQTSSPQPSETDLCLMRRSARWVVFLGFAQLVASFLTISPIMMILSAIFVVMGWVGVAKRRPRLLVAHFVYSLGLYILTLVALIAMIIYCEQCGLVPYLFGFLFLILQAVGMRHGRMLIQYTRLYPNAPACAWRRGCRARCNNNNAQSCATQTSTETETKQQPQPVAPQQPQPVAPQQPFAPMQQYYPQFVAVPQPYGMPMQQMRYPVNPQGPAMIPMGMQPYVIPFPQPQQQDGQQPLYPTVPIVYRQQN
jgi:hypothetical protein